MKTQHFITKFGFKIMIILFTTNCFAQKDLDSLRKSVNVKFKIRKENQSLLTNEDILNFYNFRELEKLYIDDPISTEEYITLKESRNRVFSIDSSVFSNFIDPVFKAEDLYRFMQVLISENYEGIRLYPGLSPQNELVLILCGSKGTQSILEKYHKILSKNSYVDDTNAIISLPIQRVDAENLHRQYLSKIKIMQLAQPDYDDHDIFFRISRYYSISQIKELMKDNIPGLEASGYTNFRNYRVKIETGFVPESLLDEFHGRNPINGIPFYHYGFTVIWQVLNQDNLSTVQTGLDYIDESTFDGRALEIGHPCPPLCGELHP
jgi:hypothetical protein